jgi:hypothetical protein
VRNEYGQSALLLAASHGHSSSVNYLLSIGADHRIGDNAGVYISFSVPFPSSSSSSSFSTSSSTSTRTPSSSSSSCCGVAYTHTLTHIDIDSHHQEISIQDYIDKYWEVKDSNRSVNNDNENREVEGKDEKIEQNVIFYTLRSPQSNYNGNQDQEKQILIVTSDKTIENLVENVDVTKNGRGIDDRNDSNIVNNDNNVHNFDNDNSKNRSISNDKKNDNGDHNYRVDRENKDTSDNKYDYSNNDNNNVKSDQRSYNDIEINDNDDNYTVNNNNDNNNNDDNNDNDGSGDDVRILSFGELSLSDKMKSASPLVDCEKRVDYQMEKIADSHVRVIGGGGGEGMSEKEDNDERMKEGKTKKKGVARETGNMTGIESGTIAERTPAIETIAGLGREEDLSTMKIPSVTYLIPHYATHAGASSLYIDDVFSESFLLQLDSLFSRLPVAAPERGAIECASRSYYCDSIGWVTEAIAKALVCLKHTEKAKRCDDFHESFNIEINGNRALGMEKGKGKMYKDSGNMECGGVRGEREEQEQGKGGAGREEQERERGEGVTEGGGQEMDGGWDDEEIHTGTGKTRNDTQATTHSTVTQALPNMRFLNYSIFGSSSPPHVDLSRRTKDNRRSTHTFLLYLTDCYEGGETRLLRSVNPRHSKGRVKRGSVEVEVEVGSNDDSCEEKGGVSKKSDGDDNNNNSNQNKNNDDNSNVNSDNTIPYNQCKIRNNSNNSTNAHKPSQKEEFSLNTDENVLSCIAPRRGRLLIFPHNCPHEGAHTITLPKILLRGEMIG